MFVYLVPRHYQHHLSVGRIVFPPVFSVIGEAAHHFQLPTEDNTPGKARCTYEPSLGSLTPGNAANTSTP